MFSLVIWGGAQHPPTGWCNRHQGHPLSAIAMTTGKGLQGGMISNVSYQVMFTLMLLGGCPMPPTTWVVGARDAPSGHCHGHRDRTMGGGGSQISNTSYQVISNASYQVMFSFTFYRGERPVSPAGQCYRPWGWPLPVSIMITRKWLQGEGGSHLDIRCEYPFQDHVHTQGDLVGMFPWPSGDLQLHFCGETSLGDVGQAHR